MSQTEFADIKEELIKTVQEIMNSDLEDKTEYDHEKAQEWVSTICDKIIKTLHEEQRRFKIMCTGTIFPKGNAALEFSAACFWNSKTDGSITVQYESDNIHCFVCLFVVQP